MTLVQLTQKKKDGFYVIISTPEAYKLQDNTTIDGTDTSAGKLVVKLQYLCSMQVDTNWF